MSALVDRLVDLPPWLVLLVAFLLPAAEASIFVGVIFPGEIAIIVAGVLANADKLPLWAVILVGTAGAVIGDSIGYEIGARFGDRLLAKLPQRLVKPEHIEKGRALLRRRGGWAVLIGRFTAALRALVPGLAGTSRVPYRVFLPFNLVGGFTWVTMCALIGYVAGASYKAAEHSVSLISGGLLAIILLAVAYRVVRGSERAEAWAARQGGRLLGRRRGKVPSTAEPSADEPSADQPSADQPSTDPADVGSGGAESPAADAPDPARPGPLPPDAEVPGAETLEATGVGTAAPAAAFPAPHPAASFPKPG